MQLKMSLSIEQVLADAQMLVGRLKEHDGLADNLISTTQTMYRRIDSMKQVNTNCVIDSPRRNTRLV